MVNPVAWADVAPVIEAVVAVIVVAVGTCLWVIRQETAPALVVSFCHRHTP